VVTATLAAHIASAPARTLPAEVVEKAKLHVLDTLAAMVSGTRLPAGHRALPFAAAAGGLREALVAGSDTVTSAAMAALAGGMLAHADETDDSHAPSLTHPGCAVVPAALALAERQHAGGELLLRAVVAGYDIGTRVSQALGGERFFDQHHSSHSVGGLFGATAAAAAVLQFDARRAAYMLAYAVQMASGNTCWRRDPDHVEKAFDFGGMPAHHAVLAATMVEAGFTGSAQPLEGTPGLFAAYPLTADPALATRDLGQRYALMDTAIKKWCVGSPIQAALDSLQALMAQHAGLTAAEVERIVVALPRQSAPVVDRRAMPSVNLQHQMALLLVDGTLGFESGHDLPRMHDPQITALADRISIDAQPGDEWVRHPRQAIVSVRLRSGAELVHRTRHVRGTPADPMTRAEVEAKARDLMAPVLGSSRTDQLIERLARLEAVADVTELRPLLCASTAAHTVGNRA
jgi:2-methylcitrate dehydratase PrpD